MAIICNSTLAPCKLFTHCPILQCVSLGRASGFNSRPRLLCPSFAHSCLFLTVMEHICRLGQNFKFTPVLPPFPNPLWNPNKPSHRLVGKQPPNATPAPTVRRQVKSHKESVATVSWSQEETLILEGAHDWRRKHQLQKLLLHNRNAADSRRHVISLDRQKRLPVPDVWASQRELEQTHGRCLWWQGRFRRTRPCSP